MKCECGGSLTESEGEQICEVCGRVASGLLFGNNLSFTDYQLNGTNIDLGHQQYKYGRKNYEDVSTRRIRRAQEELRELARLL
jgi:transcription factor IIIB 90 kDa subunit